MKEKSMNTKVEKIKNHFKENKKLYIGLGIGAVVGVAGTIIFKKNDGNQAIVDSFKLVNWKSPHTSQLIQVAIPRRGNSGNAIQCDQTGTIFPSQNLAAKEMDLNAGNLSQQLNGKIPSVNGFTFTKLTESGDPIAE